MPSGHEQADLLDVGVGRVELAEDRALVHHGDPVGEREDLVEVLADQQHGDAVGGGVAQVRVDGLDRADVEPARRRGGDDQARLAVNSRASTTFCRLPPESCRACASGPGAAIR